MDEDIKNIELPKPSLFSKIFSSGTSVFGFFLVLIFLSSFLMRFGWFAKIYEKLHISIFGIFALIVALVLIFGKKQEKKSALSGIGKLFLFFVAFSIIVLFIVLYVWNWN
jgi:hypothetical protein